MFILVLYKKYPSKNTHTHTIILTLLICFGQTETTKDAYLYDTRPLNAP